MATTAFRRLCNLHLHLLIWVKKPLYTVGIKGLDTRLFKLSPEFYVPCLPYFPNTSFVCPHFPLAKIHQLPFSSGSTQSVKPLNMLWADVWGPALFVSRRRFKYYLSIVDHFTRFTWLFPIKNKSDALAVFTSFITFAE